MLKIKGQFGFLPKNKDVFLNIIYFLKKHDFEFSNIGFGDVKIKGENFSEIYDNIFRILIMPKNNLCIYVSYFNGKGYFYITDKIYINFINLYTNIGEVFDIKLIERNKKLSKILEILN